MELFFLKHICADHAKALLIILCYSQLVLYTVKLAEAKPQRNETHYKAIFAFGDSFLDTGNNNHLVSVAKSNFPPYGRDFPNSIPTGRFSNGKVFSDLIAKGLGIKEYLPAYHDPNLQNNDLQTGLCFASGGSGYDPLTYKTLNVYSTSPDQVQFFKEYMTKLRGYVGEEKSKEIIANSLYLISVGSNDIGLSYFVTHIRQLLLNVPSYTDLLVSLASNFLKELYELGAREFALLSLPPIGCLPLLRTLEGGIDRKCSERINEAVKIYNSKLSSQIDSLQQQLSDSKFILLDFYNPLLEIIQQPSKFGFEVADRGCCGTGIVETIILCNKLDEPFTCTNTSAYVFFDSLHSTQRTYELIVSQYLHQLS